VFRIQKYQKLLKNKITPVLLLDQI
jgi:hypothetical protein